MIWLVSPSYKHPFLFKNANTVSLIKVLIAISSHLLVKIRESFLG